MVWFLGDGKLVGYYWTDVMLAFTNRSQSGLLLSLDLGQGHCRAAMSCHHPGCVFIQPERERRDWKGHGLIFEQINVIKGSSLKSGYQV